MSHMSTKSTHEKAIEKFYVSLKKIIHDNYLNVKDIIQLKKIFKFITFSEGHITQNTSPTLHPD
jgi:hypothetical protein